MHTNMLLLRRASSRKQSGTQLENLGATALVLYVHDKWHTDIIYEIALVQAQELGLNFYETFTDAGRTRSDCLV